MEIKALYPFVLMIVLVGVLIGVGVLVVDQFKTVAFNSQVIVNDSFTFNNATTVNLDYGNITIFTRIINASSAVLATSHYTVNTTDGDIAFSVTENSTCQEGATCYADYTFKNFETKAGLAAAAVRGEISTIATTWLGIIITIAVLAIILFLVIGSFGRRK